LASTVCYNNSFTLLSQTETIVDKEALILSSNGREFQTLRRVALVRTVDLEELSDFFIRVTRIVELEKHYQTTHAQKKYLVFFAACVG
jgi:hypothetical protein